MFKQLLVEENPQKERSWIELWKRCSKFWILKFDEALLLGWWEAGISGMMFKKMPGLASMLLGESEFQTNWLHGANSQILWWTLPICQPFSQKPCRKLAFFSHITGKKISLKNTPKQPVFFFIAQLAKICWSLQIVFQGTAGITTLVLFMVQKSHSQPPFGCIKPHK